MRVLISFPGRAGDILWMLPTARAISEHFGHPVDLQIAGEFSGMVDLLSQQPYLAGVWADPRWTLTPPDDWQAPRLPREYDLVVDLGYRGWPTQPLPYETYYNAVQYFLNREGRRGDPVSHLSPLDLERPWITVTPPPAPVFGGAALPTGFTDCWFELKLGIIECLERVDILGLAEGVILTPWGSRWNTEAGYIGSSWVEAAQALQQGTVFLGDCSALHVLAVALGKPCVIVEPMEARHAPIFWPLGMDGRVQVVRGNDGQPTWDARHTADALRMALKFAGEAGRG